MPYTVEDGGRLNNFAAEPTVYEAEAPTDSQKKGFVVLGVLGASLVVGLVAIAVAVSG
ncbi:MAG: photosystem II assembly protein Psb34 [Microcoleaceae cyanobacterium]